MDRKRQKLSTRKNDVQKECQDAKITALERKLLMAETRLEMATDKLEKVKEENSQLKSKIDKNRQQWTELLYENERLQKRLQDLEAANINLEEQSQITLCNSDLTIQIMKIEESNDEALGINALPNEIILKIFGYLEQNQLGVIAQHANRNQAENCVKPQVNESNDDALNINSLTNEVILKIFGFLKQNQLGQIARVCRKWNVLTMSPLLWKSVNVRFSPSHKFQTTVAKLFINRLPSCISSIRLDFTEYRNWIPLHFGELCLKLQGKCPHLKELILFHSMLSNTLQSVVNLCTHFLQDVKNLVLHRSTFPPISMRAELAVTSKIEVLDMSWCIFGITDKLEFSKMPCLKVLRLYSASLSDFSFLGDTSFLSQLHVLDLGSTTIKTSYFLRLAIQNHGLNLKELYICGIYLPAHASFNSSVFPNLQTICIYDSFVTCEGVVSLTQSCPSLENVYVNEDVVESFAAHPFVVANRSMSGIVKSIGPIHIHKVDYLHN